MAKKKQIKWKILAAMVMVVIIIILLPDTGDQTAPSEVVKKPAMEEYLQSHLDKDSPDGGYIFARIGPLALACPHLAKNPSLMNQPSIFNNFSYSKNAIPGVILSGADDKKVTLEFRVPEKHDAVPRGAIPQNCFIEFYTEKNLIRIGKSDCVHICIGQRSDAPLKFSFL